ncbi:MAG TPA: CocE/NonD family hydrolase [Steroidobacteraceae bacterium]
MRMLSLGRCRMLHGLRTAAMMLLFCTSPGWAAVDFDFRVPASPLDAATAATMSDLASRLIPVYQDSDPERYLANLSALQMAVGDYAAADISRASLRDRRRKSDFGHPIGRAVIFDMYAHAKAVETETKVTFAEAFTNVYRDTMQGLDDRDAFAVAHWLGSPPTTYRDALQRSLDQYRGKDSVDESEAIDLIWKYLSFDAYRHFGSLVVLLNAQDDHRRYSSDSGILIKGAEGTEISITVVRPTGGDKAVPALLEFGANETQSYAKEGAARGYAGVVAFMVERKSPAGIDPLDLVGANALLVIDWIVKQSWSDGRVGMYGDGYGGFAPWAAAKHLPPALKAIATSAASAPGINFPMEGNIFRNSAYGWSLQMNSGTNVKEEDDDAAQWRALNQKWYRSGRRYRDMGRLFGKHNPIFIRWLNHPSYDSYWQKFVPYRQQFAHINIPVLTITGYYCVSAPADLYYFTQHHRYNPRADHTLLIGPYEADVMRVGPSSDLRGYQVDPAALVDLRELRFEWFDHVFKGTTVPALLSAPLNYEVMGANEWRHAPSLEAAASASQRYYLDAAVTAGNHHLSQRKKSGDLAVPQTVSFLDRKDAAWTPPTDYISKSLAPRHGTIYISDPLTKAISFNGLFSGRLDFAINKMDVDLNMTLYELLANGDYIRLFSPTYEIRASYAQDRVHRHLLKAGERQKLSFKSERMTSVQLQPGSRLALVLSIAKRPDREINYGTGGDVSEESIADGKIPVEIQWYGDSYIDIPIKK